MCFSRSKWLHKSVQQHSLKSWWKNWDLSSSAFEYLKLYLVRLVKSTASPEVSSTESLPRILWQRGSAAVQYLNPKENLLLCFSRILGKDLWTQIWTLFIWNSVWHFAGGNDTTQLDWTVFSSVEGQSGQWRNPFPVVSLLSISELRNLLCKLRSVWLFWDWVWFSDTLKAQTCFSDQRGEAIFKELQTPKRISPQSLKYECAWWPFSSHLEMRGFHFPWGIFLK